MAEAYISLVLVGDRRSSYLVLRGTDLTLDPFMHHHHHRWSETLAFTAGLSP